MVDRWHYTVGESWELIRASGVIRLSGTVYDPSERPAVWFSRREQWEPAAATLLQGPDRIPRSAVDAFLAREREQERITAGSSADGRSTTPGGRRQRLSDWREHRKPE